MQLTLGTFAYIFSGTNICANFKVSAMPLKTSQMCLLAAVAYDTVKLKHKK